MGPKVLQRPVLLVLAYLGIGYVSWVLSLLILGYRDKPLKGVRLIAQPVLAGFLMCSWDLSMDPSWSTYHRAWIWLDGGHRPNRQTVADDGFLRSFRPDFALCHGALGISGMASPGREGLLERELHRRLQNPRRSRAHHPPERRTPQHSVHRQRPEKLRVIEHIERLHPEQHRHRFRERHVLT